MWEAIDAAGDAFWVPPRFAGAPPSGVRVEDLAALSTGWLAIGRGNNDLFVAPVVVADGRARRATAGDGVIAALLEGSDDGSLALHATGTTMPPLGEEQAIEVDQTNESVVLGEGVIVKMFVRTRPGPQPAADLPAHLVAVGFTEMPAPYGSVAWREDTLVATATAFVPGARDGWEWYVELLQRDLGGRGWDEVDAVPIAIGGVVARLHRALATPSALLPEPRAVAPRRQIGDWRVRAENRLYEAISATGGAAGERLRAIADRARTVLERLDEIDKTPVQRIHGDLHVGQLLRAGAGPLLVCDFDGNPLTPSPASTAREATARDVAAMAAAIDHVGRVVARREPIAARVIEDWIERSREAFLASYREALGDQRHLFDERLLHPFAIQQEANEFVYAARFLPRWGYVPDAAMPAAIRRAETGT